jgi:hypothetical protein
VDLAAVLAESGNHSAAELELHDILPTALRTLGPFHPMMREILSILEQPDKTPLNRRDRREQQRQQRRRR